MKASSAGQGQGDGQGCAIGAAPLSKHECMAAAAIGHQNRPCTPGAGGALSYPPTSIRKGGGAGGVDVRQQLLHAPGAGGHAHQL